jgi:hypothetical protein
MHTQKLTEFFSFICSACGEEQLSGEALGGRNENGETGEKKVRTQHTTNHAMILTYIKRIMKHERNTNERNVNWSFLRSCEFKVDLWCICVMCVGGEMKLI